MWSTTYADMIQRNIGLLTEGKQEVLKNSKVVVLGAGGLGGVISEILVRSGIENIKIVDFDKFEPTNFNRQIFAFNDTIGKWKIDVAEEFLLRINPDLKINKYKEITEENAKEIIQDTNVVVLAIDSSKPCVISSRVARELNVPLVEGWAIPFGNVRVFTKDTPSLEEVYGFPTIGKSTSSITEDEYKQLKLHMIASLKRIEGVENFYPPFAVERIMSGKIPSFAPLVWLTAVLMALEAEKVLLNWGEISYAPKFKVFNPF